MKLLIPVLLLYLFASDIPTRPTMKSNPFLVFGGKYSLHIEETSGNCGGTNLNYSFTFSERENPNIYCDVSKAEVKSVPNDNSKQVGYYAYTNCCHNKTTCQNVYPTVSGTTAFDQDGNSGNGTQTLRLKHCTSEYNLSFKRIQ